MIFTHHHGLNIPHEIQPVLWRSPNRYLNDGTETHSCVASGLLSTSPHDMQTEWLIYYGVHAVDHETVMNGCRGCLSSWETLLHDNKHDLNKTMF